MTNFDESHQFEVELTETYQSSESEHRTPVIKSGRRHDDPENHHQSNPFVIPFVLILSFAIIELFTGIWSNSLALLSDAWHMFSDVFAIGLAMLAFRVAKRRSDKTSRAQLTASIINAVLMFAVIAWIINEALVRFSQPTSIQPGVVVVVGMIGLLINLFVAQHLHFNNPSHQHAGHHHGHDHQHLNHQAALLHVIGDILGSVAALVSGLVIYLTGWQTIDPILSLLIAGLLLVGTVNLCRNIAKALRKS